MSDDVPDELLREILSRLPVALLLRFRCVCSRWKTLIDSHQFSKDHLNHSKKTNSNLNIVVRSYNLHSASFDLLNETNRSAFQKLSHPLKSPYTGTEILGSCNGLLVLSNGDEEESILWNPSVRRFHELPVAGIELPEYFATCQYTVYGFGYDCLSDDYKIVRIIQFYGGGIDEFDSEVKVYSLKSDSWKRVSDLPYYLKYKRCNGEFANGALHWVVSRKIGFDTNNLVAAFDLATEEYRLVPLPRFTGCVVFNMNVFVLGGCLGLMCSYFMNHVDIWVMKEYGVQESWSILLTLDESEVSFKRFEYLKPIGYSKCGKKVLLGLDSYGLIWYDLDNKSIDLPTIQMPLDIFFEFHTCLQSLLLLNNGTCDRDIVTKK